MKTNENWINLYYNFITAEWNFATNINAENEKKKVQAFWISIDWIWHLSAWGLQLNASLQSARFLKEIFKNFTSQFPNWKQFKDPDLLRQSKHITILGTSALPEEQLQEVPFQIFFKFKNN